MKTKKITIIYLAMICLLLIAGCRKKEPNVAPVADTETQSALDAVWATYVITDIDQICGFIGEDQFFGHFYSSTTGLNQTIRDLDAKQLVLGWNNSACADGHVRHGSVFLNYKKDLISNPNANENSRYYRDFGYVGNVSLSNYKVDGWLITLFDPAAHAYIYNRLTTDRYDPRTQRLSWLIAGKFLLAHPSDPSKNIVWDGQIIKTLVNSTDGDIFNTSKQMAINWTRTDLKPQKAALVTYHGKISGSTSANKPFTMTIDERTPLVRDFLCSSDVVADASRGASGSMVITREEHHPFVGGIATFTTKDKYPRQIYFGNEGSPDRPSQCDNTGEILIKGNSYRVNFLK